MLQRFYPDEYLDSIHVIDFNERWNMGYRSIIFDIDNTLVEHGAPATTEIISFFHKLQEIGFQVLFLSNNKEPRVQSFRDAIGYGDYIYKAGKPNSKNYIVAMNKMKTDCHNTLFIGDQLFTDVWGAKKTGIHTILVKPIDKKEEIQIILKRILEKPILNSYKKSLAREKKKQEV